MYWNKSQTIDGGMGTELVRCGAKEVGTGKSFFPRE